jgi:hypothetical protein
MAAKKHYHKPAEDPRTIGGGLKAAGRERREKLQMIINTKPRNTRNDLLPSMELQTLAIADLKMPKNMVRKLDEGHIKEIANGIQAMGFSVPVLVGKLAVANLVTIELQAGNTCHNRFKQRLTFNKRQGCGVAAIEMQKVEGVKDQAHAARAIGRGLGLSEVRKAVLADPTQFAVEIGGLRPHGREGRKQACYLPLQSRPVRVRSFAWPRSIRSAIRKPSSLIS